MRLRHFIGKFSAKGARDVQGRRDHGVHIAFRRRIHRRTAAPMTSERQAPPGVLFVGNSTLYFLLHRLTLARALVRRGFRVAVLLPEPISEKDRASIAVQGIEVHEYPYQPTGTNPLVELRSLMALVRHFRRLKPDVTHHLTLKPALYGGIVARVIGIDRRVNAITGLGYLFHSSDGKARLLRRMLVPAFRYAFGGRGSIVTVENTDDLSQLRMAHAIGTSEWPRGEVLPGSGVDPADYDPGATPDQPPIVLFAGRLLRAKGFVEFVEAARRVKRELPATRFVVCGGLVPGNPDAVSEREVRAGAAEGVVEWWGNRDDISAILGRTSIVVLPSYREGLPRILLEAAAAGRPIVSTDTEGCREICRNGMNGFLVPVRDTATLAEAILRLLNNPKLGVRMGREGRKIVEREYSLEIVIHRTLALYDRMF